MTQPADPDDRPFTRLRHLPPDPPPCAAQPRDPVEAAMLAEHTRRMIANAADLARHKPPKP